MLLAIDIGNTNIVIGCIEAEKICHELRLATDLVKTSDQYWMDLKGVLALYDLQADEIEGVIISSVVPPVLNSLRTAVMKLTGRTPMVVGPGLKTGLNIAGGNAGQVGSDLVVAAVAALRELGYTLGQGFHLAEPMAADGVARLLARQRSMAL